MQVWDVRTGVRRRVIDVSEAAPPPYAVGLAWGGWVFLCLRSRTAKTSTRHVLYGVLAGGLATLIFDLAAQIASARVSSF